MNGIRFGYLFVATSFHVGFVSAIWHPETHWDFYHLTGTGMWPLDEFARNIGAGISLNFVVGGMLCYVTWLPVVKKTGSLKLHMFLIGRWLRTTPLIAGSLLIVWAFPVQWGSGPVWRSGYHNITTTCLSRWWTEFVYIGNMNMPGESVSCGRQWNCTC